MAGDRRDSARGDEDDKVVKSDRKLAAWKLTGWFRRFLSDFRESRDGLDRLHEEIEGAPRGMKYRRKAETIEAVKFESGGDLPAWALRRLDRGRIFTEDGAISVKDGDYICRSSDGSIYPIKADVFEKMYEAVE
jgi:hypothetical protein